ncbi:MAG: AAA family ATPase [Planctomycetes bacterium]|nr:AAA family ATPase [Planctomycetota bacterium]
MDCSRFNLDRQPFRPAVDPDSYFPSPSHETALAAVAAGFARRDPVVLLDGPSGVGKTLIARKWLEHLLPDVPRVMLPSARAEKPAELLQAILFDLGKPYKGLTEQELRLTVTESLLDAATESSYPTVLILDEAQHLSQMAFEELRLLGNLETKRGAAVFVLLVAHPMLRDAFRRPAYELFVQRIGVRVAVELLTTEESVAYLNHQVEAAGGEPEKLFEEEALSLIAGACEGVPRLLNRAAALALELAAGSETKKVDVEAALEALDRLELEPAESEETGEPGEPVLLQHPSRATDRNRNDDAGESGSKNRATRPRTA